MPRLGSKKSRNGCLQCKARRVKVISFGDAFILLPTTYRSSVTKTGRAAHALDIESNAVFFVLKAQVQAVRRLRHHTIYSYPWQVALEASQHPHAGIRRILRIFGQIRRMSHLLRQLECQRSIGCEIWS